MKDGAAPLTQHPTPMPPLRRRKMRYIKLAKMAALTCVAGLFVSMTSACTLVVHDDVHARGSSGMFGDDEYRAVDNAIYDVLVEQYGKDRVLLVAAPEREHHRWTVTSDEFAIGSDRQRTRIEARAMSGSDGYWFPEVKVTSQFTNRGFDTRVAAPSNFGTNPWINGGSNGRAEAKIVNSVNAKVREWRMNGSQKPGNRRDEWLDRTTAGGR